MLSPHIHSRLPSLVRFGLISHFLVAFGCSAWKEAPPEGFQLPVTRMSPESVALEITFIRVPVGETSINSDLWQQVDEQILSATGRLHLNSNGFRCGIVGTQLPEILRDLLDQQRQAKGLDQAVLGEMDILVQNRLVQNRSGQRTEVVASSSQKDMVVLHKDALGEKVAGKSFRDAQSILALRAFPQGDGSVRLQLTPEVHHGAPKPQWVAGEGTLRLKSGRDREVFQDLVVGVVINPGQSLLLSCTPDLKGLGHNFFVDDGRGDPQQKLLLIRLSQSQRDELFDQQVRL